MDKSLILEQLYGRKAKAEIMLNVVEQTGSECTDIWMIDVGLDPLELEFPESKDLLVEALTKQIEILRQKIVSVIGSNL
jgi:hypothetical protein